MNQIRISKKDNFTVVDNCFIRDDNLSWKAKGLLIYLLHLPNDWVVSLSDLKNRSKDGRDSTNNGIKELMKKGYVTRKQIKVNNRFDGYEYTVMEIPSTGNKYTENQCMENPTLLSTKELRTKKERTKEENTLVRSQSDDSFEEFWELYDKKVGRKKCITKWKRISNKDKKLIMEFIPKYKKSLSDIKFIQHPLTFLNGETWNDEVDTVSKNLVSVKQNIEGFKRPSSRVVIGFKNGKPIYEK